MSAPPISEVPGGFISWRIPNLRYAMRSSPHVQNVRLWSLSPVVYLPGITLIEILKTAPYRTQQHGHVHDRHRFQILDLYGYALRIDGSLLLIALLTRLYSGEVQPPAP